MSFLFMQECTWPHTCMVKGVPFRSAPNRLSAYLKQLNHVDIHKAKVIFSAMSFVHVQALSRKKRHVTKVECVLTNTLFTYNQCKEGAPQGPQGLGP